MLLDGTGRRESTGVLRLDSADTETRKKQKQLATDVFITKMNARVRRANDIPTLEVSTETVQSFSEWFETHHTAKRRGAERERYALQKLRARLGPRLLVAVTRATVQEYASDRLADGVKPGTVNREVAVLKAILREAVNAGHLKASPLVRMKPLRTVPIRKRVLSQSDEDRLLEAMTPADRALYVVAVDTLMRLSNVLNLRRADDRGTYLQLEDSKTGPYVVPLSTRARQALDAMPKTGEYFFAHRRVAKTERDRRSVIRRMLKAACKRAGLPYGRATAGFTFHIATRATGATRIIRAGFDQKTLMEVGNWKDMRSLQEYLVTDMDRKGAAVNQIGAGSTVSLKASPAKRKRNRGVSGNRRSA